MKKIKSFFATPKKAILSICCIAICLLLIGTGTVFAAEAIAEKKSIGKTKAKSIALADAGLTSDNIQMKSTKFNFRNGEFVYDVEFVSNGKKYEYRLSAFDGNVIKKDQEFVSNLGSEKNGATISIEQATTIALNDAGVSSEEVTFTKAELDKDDNELMYDIEFYSVDTEYDYEINALTGEIHDKDIERRNESDDKPQPQEHDDADKISLAEAKNIALKDAGVSSSEATFTKAELDRDDEEGLMYEIDFYTSNTEYEYEIDAYTGKIIDKDKESRKDSDNKPNPQETDDATKISLAEAKNIALKDAGVSSSDATFTKAELDRDDDEGLMYEIDFYTSNAEYEYEIDAYTGKIIDKDKESRRDSDNEPNPKETDDAKKISLKEAKNIALKDAGVSSSKATFTKAELDKEDNVYVYDIEFYTSDTEYEYEINAYTGKIIDKDTERRENSSNNPQKEFIGVDAAKAIALKHAKLSASQVRFSKAKLEEDDGRYEYEIEFYCGNIEYEYTIDAITGEIIEFESEEDDDD